MRMCEWGQAILPIWLEKRSETIRFLAQNRHFRSKNHRRTQPLVLEDEIHLTKLCNYISSQSYRPMLRLSGAT
jgi:hypothetical protein